MPTVDGWMKTVRYGHMMECHSALKKKEILPYVRTRVCLEDTPLGETGKFQNDKRCMIPLLSSWSSQIHRRRAWNGGCHDPGEQETKNPCSGGMTFHVSKMNPF